MYEKKSFKGKPLTILYIYPPNFPYVPISVIILEGFLNVTDLADSNIRLFVEGGHNFNGIICYQNHEPIPGKTSPNQGSCRENRKLVSNWKDSI